MKRFVRLARETVVRRIKDSGLLPSYRVRENLAKKYLGGCGLEIGALHLPLAVPTGVTVRYVDLATREEQIRLHPELPADRIVHTDYVDDGFALRTIEPASQDFVIANHVLEHSPNPLQVLMNWGRVVKPGGILFISTPLADKCFDKGRSITSIEHLIEDYRLCGSGNTSAYALANREHYREWLTVSEPAIRRSRGEEVKPLSPEQLECDIDSFSSRSTEIHFHTFTQQSFMQMLEYFVHTLVPAAELREVRSSRGARECVAIVQKK